MSSETTGAPSPAPTDLWGRIERYGPAGLILVALGFWMKPHIDNLVADHREFLKTSTAVQQEQSKTMAVGTQCLQELKATTNESNQMIRDIRGRLVYGRQGLDETSKMPD